MAVVVIGGQASGVGKTGAICGLIRAMPERQWTAIKITQCSHHGGGKACDCKLHGASVAIAEEHDRTANTDSSRYLAAGAVRSLWVRTLPGHLGEAMPRIEEEIRRAENVVIESNAVMEFLEPEIYALVVAPDVENFKPSARRYLDRADAILTMHTRKADAWRLPEAVERSVSFLPRFCLDAGTFVSPEFVGFVRHRLDRWD